ncbi:hypothetical protein [[Flexibacter] sp. ATCC 35208]|uniref:hypothetical protein n=1 Tax=[Flexibacter] sp. ATCC 35208 TaxID=1936242 RepID=UPI0009CCA039|nr:hypothetical protein [[Flexibacter] sp. ATCC 35208]OMP77683.1 hypothetical protein BW716_18260 [[Flexibacter] sp. ATCC 35208]
MMKVRIIGLSCLLFVAATVRGQRISATDAASLNAQQDSLKYLSDLILRGRDEDSRQNASDRFIPKLVQALKTPNSFYFPFDSITTVSIQYPQDSTFRIFTWGVERENTFFHHYGAIQMRTEDGKLKLFPLFDASDYILNTDTITDNKNWYGCLYYKILQRRFFNTDYYTLFGWDANNLRSQKKMIEMLSFKDGKPVFGGPFFSFAEDTVPKPLKNRFILEYKKEATISLSYNAEMDMIVYDHLISETNQKGKPSTYVPDLDYEGLKWKGGKWVHIDKVFHDALQLGKYPVGQPLDMKKKDLTNPKTTEEMNEETLQKQQQSSKKKPK